VIRREGSARRRDLHYYAVSVFNLGSRLGKVVLFIKEVIIGIAIGNGVVRRPISLIVSTACDGAIVSDRVNCVGPQKRKSNINRGA